MDFVALELIRELQKIDSFHQYIIAVGAGDDVCLHETSNFKIEVLPSANYFVWEQILLPRLVKKYNASLLHCTSNTAPLAVDVPLLLTLHDIIFMENKIGNNASMYQKLGRIYRRWVVPRIIQKASQVITVSNYEKDNITKRYPGLSPKIHTVYNGVGEEFEVIADRKSAFFPDLEKDSFWLFLGNTDPKKNMANTLLGYAAYVEASAEPRKLLLIDTDEKVLDNLLQELSITRIKPLLIIKEYISHDQLPYLYNAAFGFLYTSLRESFGLPLLEAMACGTVVLASNTTAIPEVAGDTVLYIDPKNPSSIGESMLLLDSDPLLYASLVEKGLVHCKQYNWHHTAVQTLTIYHTILGR